MVDDIERIKRRFKHLVLLADLMGMVGTLNMANSALQDVYIYLGKHPELFRWYCVDCFEELKAGTNPGGVPMYCQACEGGGNG